MSDVIGDKDPQPAPAPKLYTEEEVAGLKANAAALLAEKKEMQKKAKDAEDARLLAEQEKAKQSGELEQFEKSIRDQYDPVIAEKDARLVAREARILSSERKAVIAGFSGILVDESASDILAMMVKTEFNGDDVVTKFVSADGNVITTDPAQFKEYLCKHKAFSHLIKADAASGGGAGGNKNPGGAGKTFDQMTLTERAQLANTDPARYAQLSKQK